MQIAKCKLQIVEVRRRNALSQFFESQASNFRLPIALYLLRVLCVLCGLFVFVATSAAAASVVVTVEGEAFAGELVSIGEDGGLSFRVDVPPAEADSPGRAEIRSLKADEFVRWRHPAPPHAQTWVLLADGSLLVAAADWSGDAPVRTQDDQFVVLSDVFDEIPLPPNVVRGLVFAPREHPEERERLAKIVREESSRNDPPLNQREPSPDSSLKGRGMLDEVLLANEDRLVGELVKLDRASLTLRTETGEVKLSLSRVEAVGLAGARTTGGSQDHGFAAVPSRPQAPEHSSGLQRADEPSPDPSLKGRGTLVGLRDGSLLHSTVVRGDKDNLSIELEASVRLQGGAIDDVVFLQSLGRKRFVYLSDLEPVDYRHVPYLSIEWPYERDRNVLGGPLSVGGERYVKGIGMHSAARLAYRLDGNYRRFDAAVAIDDSAGRRGNVTFSVYLLRDGKWQEAYKSEIVRGGAPPVPISVDVSGAQGLTLMVDYAERGDELDHADWLDARLVRN